MTEMPGHMREKDKWYHATLRSEDSINDDVKQEREINKR